MMVLLVAVLGLTLAPAAAIADSAPTAVLSLDVSAVDANVNAGDPASFVITWACSSVADSCDDVKLIATIPTAQPDDVGLVVQGASGSADGIEGAPDIDAAAGTVTWTFPSAVPAGKSGQVTLSMRAPNFDTPNGSTITPTATLTAANAATVTTEATTTVQAYADLEVVKVLANPKVVPLLDQPVTYRLSAAQPGELTSSATPTFVCTGTGKAKLENVVLVDYLPEGAVFESATGDYTYDPDAHTVTWAAWDEGKWERPDGGSGCNWPPVRYVTVSYPSSIFESTDIVTNTATATAHPYLRPEETLTADAGSASHTFAAELTGAGSLAKRMAFPGGSQWRGQRYFGQGGTYWSLQYANTGNVALQWDATDMLPCFWTSPTSLDDTVCATPAIKDVALWLSSGVPGDTAEVTYTTNVGNTGTLTLHSGSGEQVTPITSDSEWITKVVVSGTIAAGNSGALQIGGRINPDLPHTVPADAPYQRPNTYTGPDSPAQPLYIENCMASSRLMFDGELVAEADPADWAQSCGYMNIYDTSAQIVPTKTMTDNVQPINGEMTVTVGTWRRFGDGAVQPIIADLLPEDLRYVPGQTPAQVGPSAAAGSLNPDNLQTEVIDDYNGTGRQLVRFTWPGDEIPPTSTASSGTPVQVTFKVQVQPGAPIGTRENTVMVFQDNYENQSPNLSMCFGASTEDTLNLSGKNNPNDRGCAKSASYTVLATGAVTADEEVRGSADADYVSAPAVGIVTPGDAGSYKVNVTNSGNIPLTGIVSYDVLPHPGDTGVGPASSQERGSQWSAQLTGPVTVPDVPDAVVSYSTSDNPCRGEVFSAGGTTASAPAGCVDDWTTTLPADPSTVTAVRVDYGDLQWEPGDVHPYLVEVAAPANASGVAWNSVALAAQISDDGSWLLPVEPRKVGLSAVDTSIRLVKKTNGVDVAQGPGPQLPVTSDVEWTYEVTNTGNTPLDEITVTDVDNASNDVAVTCPAGPLAPTETITCTAEGVAVEGQYHNTATATGTPVDDDGAPIAIEKPTDVDESWYFGVTTDLTLLKSADKTVVTQVGETVEYAFEVTNNGNAPVTDLGIDDQLAAPAAPALDVSCPTTTLAPDGGSTVCTATYTVTQADLDNGSIDNTATAHGTAAGEELVTEESSWHIDVLRYSASKASDPASGSEVDAGQVVTYTLTVANTGTVPVSATFSDDMTGVIDDADYNADVLVDGSDAPAKWDGETLSWSGDVPVEGTVTITYSVTVKEWQDQGDHELLNVLVSPGCDGDCQTSNEVTPPEGPTPPPVGSDSPRDGGDPLASTGSSVGIPLGIAAVCLVVGGVLAAGFRKRSSAQ